ncbi:MULTISPECIES: tyrosine-type recombinase/integrase [Providencia]|uniref:Tyrosine-type recombinase/integrase n=2 Tax=Providencia TaxID=586 RepID=A0AB35LIC9_PRORE|nr:MULTISPECIES: tyrosine-type recombinase/integrase [Providencia]ELR5147636.1 tyrosine-type recombinase/integrase [Providencia rettgeri]ELY3857954.1 tyrosine-type recombinase/integrase [Providencia rettgeri]MBG5925418.1 tyrosine-type recombinase/integrase [Providencia rettgeri]MBI6194858.1 tyrosine-type recombinase/integrase [Providencia rettgeri]MBI6203595.1 tyrosine-type recombinase/integrase [Providencia rettgeri]
MSAFFPVKPESGKSILQRQSQALLQNGYLERARQLRNLAIAAELDCPKYLLAPEVNQLLQFIPDLHQRTLIDTLWNTGARIHEALALTKGDFYLDEETPFVVLRTLKQRERQTSVGQTKVKSRPKRIVALFDPQYVQLMKSYFATMRLKNQSQIWPIQSDNTVRNWLRSAVEQAEVNGASYVVNPITCKTFRHSFAMHLIFNGVPMKVIQAYLGHKKSSSTDIYTKIFTLDTMLHFDISFR